MAITELSKETIEEMKQYNKNVKRKGINEDYYHMRCHHAFALYEVLLEDPLEAFISCFDYGFAKGIQAERNRLKKA